MISMERMLMPRFTLDPYLWAIVIPLLLGVAFLDKPFHIDDVSFLAVAHQIVADPLYPHSQPTETGEPDELFQISSSPFISYYYAM